MSMNLHQDTAYLLIILALALFSLADLKYRVAPGVEVLFFGAVLLKVFNNPLGVLAILMAMAVAWQQRPSIAMWVSTLYPSAWPVLLVSSGVRRGMIGTADLWAIGSIAILFPLPAVVLSLIGVDIWRRWWQKWHRSDVPALPGMFLGIVLYALGTLLIQQVT